MINILPYEILESATHGKYEKIQKKYKFKISAPTWNEKFELTDGSYSLSHIQQTECSKQCDKKSLEWVIMPSYNER